MSHRRVRLTVLDHREPVMAFVDWVPKTRAECPSTAENICIHVNCRAHLLRVSGQNRAGRPSLRLATRGEHGHVVRELGSLGDERHGTVDARYLDEYGNLRWVESCAFDAIERHGGPMTNEEIGDHTGRHRTLMARIAKRALRAWTDAGATLEGIRLLTTPDDPANDEREPSKARRR